jgi:gliding motility-associated-like protein
MGKDNLKNLICSLWFVLPALALHAQPNDCRRAIVICDDRPFSFTPRFGAGLDDFLNPKNDQGCLERRENISVWFYFEFRKDMPPGYGISFTLSDSVRIRGQDYDFAIYGPNLTCDSLGRPVRCSFAQISPNQNIIRTGLGGGAVDTTEDLTGDGFVDSLIVQPGQGFFMLIDFFVGIGGTNFDSTLAQSFRLNWGGRAAPFLNCIANPNCDLVTVDAKPDTSICAGTTLNLTVSAANTNGNASVRWSGVGEADSFIEQRDSAITRIIIPANAAGLFSFIATIGEGNCEHTDEIAVNVLPLPQPEITGERIICPGDTATLRAPPGFAAYRWSPGNETASSILVTETREYGLTVTNHLGCQGTDTFTVQSKNLPSPTILGDSVLCPGESSQLTADPGYASYQWTNGDTVRTITVQTGDFYGVTLTDSDGCFVTGGTTVRGVIPQRPTLNGQSYFCEGTSTTIRANAGFQSYAWSNGSVLDSAVVNAPGLLRLTVSDLNSCESVDSILITRRDNPVPVISGDRTFCSGASTLLIATPGYESYEWNNGVQDSFQILRQPGVFIVTVSDTFKCVGRDTAVVDTLAKPKTRMTGPTELCEGQFDRISPGTFASYIWSTGEIFPDIRVDQSGTYRVTVTGFNGCTNTDSLTLTVHPNPVPIIGGLLTICPDTFSLLSVQNGFSGYLWSNGDTLPQLEARIPGRYDVLVIDQNGCRGGASVMLRSVPSPVVEVRGDSVACEGTVTHLYATPGFDSYRWSTGDQNDSIVVMAQREYSVEVIDSNGCVGYGRADLRLLDNPEVEIEGPGRFCEGSFTTIHVPRAYFRYEWSTGEVDSLIQVRQPGIYSVTVATLDGCTRTDSIQVDTDAPIPPDLQPGNYQFCQGDSVRLEAGAGFISYTWSDGSSKPFLSVKQAGNYQLTVLDTNYCISSVFFRVDSIRVFTPSIFGAGEFCEGQQIPLIVTGNRYLNYLWSTGDTTDLVYIGRGGEYRVTVTDFNGCLLTARKEVIERPAPDIEIVGDLSICRGDSTRLSVPGGYGFYNWTNGVNGDTSIVVSRPGRYGILVLGANGCAISDEVEVVQSRIPFPIIDGEKFLCTKDSVVLEVEAGFASYTWTTGETTNRIVVRQDSTYGVTITDTIGCDGKAQVRVIAIQSPDALAVGRQEICPGDSTVLTSSGLFPGYRWFPDTLTTRQITVSQPGWYVLEVEAANGCTDRDSVRVVQAPVPEPDIGGDLFFCADSMASLVVPDTFQTVVWSNGIRGPGITVTQPGLVGVTVTNDLGCIGTDTATVRLVIPPVPDPGVDTSLTCNRRSVPLGAPAGASLQGILAAWEGPGINAQNRNLLRPQVSVPGLYRLVVADSVYGCPSLSAQVSVVEASYTPAVALADEDTLDCVTPQVFLNGAGSASGPEFRYIWTREGTPGPLGSDSIRIGVAQPGHYFLEVLDTLTGCRAQTSLTIGIDTVAPVPAILDAGVLTCDQDSILLRSNAPPIGQQWLYSWSLEGAASPIGAGPSAWITAPGRYALRVVNARNGCAGQDSALVGIDTIPPVAVAGADQALDCLSLEATLGGETPNPDWEYFWRDASTGFILSRRPELTVSLPGIYLYQSRDPRNGCIDTDSAEVLLHGDLPDSLELDIRPETCVGLQNGSMAIRLVAGGEAPYLFRLSGADGYSANQSFSNLKPGVYRITVQDAQGCEYTERFTIDAGIAPELNLGDDLFIKRGEIVRLVALTNIPEETLESLVWTQPDTLQHKAARELRLQPLNTTEYAATVRDTNGCEASDQVTVFVDRTQRVYIPNAFSPNGDGANDVFMIFSGLDVVRIKTLRLFNRWGTMVYDKGDFPPNDPLYGWNGFHRGELQNAGVYAYYAEVEFIDGSTDKFEGDVTLVR